MKLSELKINSAAIEAPEGRWIDAPGLGDIRFKVRGLGNADFRRLQAKLTDKVPRHKKIEGRIAPDEVDRISTVVLLDTILQDWSGLTDDDGAPLKYSRDQAEKLLSDPDFRMFRDSVFGAASLVGEEIAESIETAAKN